MWARKLPLICALTLCLAQPAMAQMHDGPNGPMDRDPRGGGEEMRHFDDHHKHQIESYMRRNYRGSCPPGQYKKYKHCRDVPEAPRYVIGEHVPHGYKPVPSTLRRRLGPPPVGTSYVMVDQDVLLISQATKNIIDAVTLLSAVK